MKYDIKYYGCIKDEKEEIIRILRLWIIQSNSKIVIVNSLQTLAVLAKKDEKYRQYVIDILKESIKNGSPAVINRGKKLIDKLN